MLLLSLANWIADRNNRNTFPACGDCEGTGGCPYCEGSGCGMCDFSSDEPLGKCPHCEGLGHILTEEPNE